MFCPFCHIDPDQIVWRGSTAVAIRDRNPVTPGHTLVLPIRHVPTWFDATPEEQAEIWSAVSAIKASLDVSHRPDGYNVGFNSGAAAGQTVMHMHMHIIPRRHGNVDDPAGGVRFVIPERGNSHSKGAAASAGSRLVTGGIDPFDRHLRPALRAARRVDILAAFVQGSGVDYLDYAITTALEQGACFRVLTGDYLHITQAKALRRLHDWSGAAATDEHSNAGTFTTRVVETASIGGRSFHPKSWRFESETAGVAWVGSSNWSRMALTHGIEWNLRIERDTDPGAYAEVVDAFESLWRDATPLTQAWLIDYAERTRAQSQPLPLGDGDDVAPEVQYRPREVQTDALKALAQSRQDGRSRALVVLATGLGKTFLAAFDVEAMAESLDRMPRVLFLAHRRELLVQAAKTFRKVFPDASIGYFHGNADGLDADLVFASVQKITLAQNLSALAADRFDYVVVDESHHATAASYRRILRHLTPLFCLGLTATPERADQADVAGLFDDHVAFRADLGEGIDSGRLVPFDYVGLPDTIEFAAIPWRQYSVDALATLAETQARMARLHEAWLGYPGSRTLVFCVSIHHADYVASWLRKREVRIVACHSGDGSADREVALADLQSGALDAIAAVDLFNEGIDVPLIDRVVMLRPTGSPVVFLQQLGRGLRVAEGKERLQVIDFIGNHRVFLNKIRTLLSLSARCRSVGEFLRGDSGQIELKAGCRVDIELTAIDMLRKFLPAGSKNETVRIYRELRDAREARPAPGELVRMGLNPRSLKADSWFAFVEDEGDLSDAEAQAFESGREWFRHLESRGLAADRLLAIEALLDEDLFGAVALPMLARLCHAALGRDPALRDDLNGGGAFDAGPASDEWLAHWRRRTEAALRRSRWFTIEAGRLTFRQTRLSGAPLTEDAAAAFQELTRQAIDMRLASLRRRRDDAGGESSFVCKVIRNARHPILKLPDAVRDQLPRGETDVRLHDGRVWQFNLVKIACNVARPVGTQTNALPDLLYDWFGPSAGKPGTDYRVLFRRSPEGWWVEPLGLVVERPPTGEVIAYPTLRAAAGATGESQSVVEAETVRLPHGGDGRFAVRAVGDSMDGGKSPIRNGDWVIMQWARGLGLDAVADHVCLLARGDADVGSTYHLKRVRRLGSGIRLQSDNRLAADLPVTEDTDVIARMVEVVRPEAIAPAPGTVVASIQDAFGLSEEPPPGMSRIDGHLFFLVYEKDRLKAPDRLAWAIDSRAPSETAFILTARGDGWRYAGVGRWDGDAWVHPAVDFATWRALGQGRQASRALDPIWERAAANLVEFIAQTLPKDGRIEARSRVCRFQGRSATGGIRIDRESMRERTISITDLAWVLQTWNHRNQGAGILDEAAVNHLRYLEGTPKTSTRWIDTGWALVILDHAIQAGFVASLTPVEGNPFSLEADGRTLDATVHIDRNVLGTSVVVEARGGAAGSAGARNTEYSEGLKVLLAALKAQGCTILQAYVDSQALSALPVDHRLLDPGPQGWPLELKSVDPNDLAARFRRSMALVGRAPDAKGSGNSTRRIRLELAGADQLLTT